MTHVDCYKSIINWGQQTEIYMYNIICMVCVQESIFISLVCVCVKKIKFDNIIELECVYHMLHWVHLAWVGFEITTLVVIGTDCIGSCKSNYYTIRTTTMMDILLECTAVDDLLSSLSLESYLKVHPRTEEYTITLSYLLTWRLLLYFFKCSTSEVIWYWIK
jgi:molybdopterin/thiamine biosynthesis adenylyltransferase